MDGPLKIGMVSSYDYAFHGGVTDHINKLTSELRHMGHAVRIIAPCSEPQGIEDEDFIPMGRPVPVPSGGSIARVSVSVWLRPRIKAMLQREAFDVVHLHEPFASFVSVGVLSNADAGHAVHIGTFHTNRGTHLYRVGAKRPLMRYFRRLDGKIAVSNPAYQFISRHFPSKYEIIPNGINVGEFEDAPRLPELQDGKTNLLFVGRLEKRKGLKYLLGAYSRLKWDWPDLRLIVVGPGKPDADSYRIMSERNIQDVIFTGRISDEEKARYYKSAHIFCSPATGRESFGIVLLEAMAAGTPVIASRIEGYSSVITSGQNGLLVPPKDEEALANAIELVLKDHDLRLARTMHEGHAQHAPAPSWQRQMGASRPPAFGGRPTVCSRGLQPSLRGPPAVFLASTTLARTARNLHE